jgi:hypothetical protein
MELNSSGVPFPCKEAFKRRVAVRFQCLQAEDLGMNVVVVVGVYAYAFYFGIRIYSPSLAILFYLPPYSSIVFISSVLVMYYNYLPFYILGLLI